jgi:hypothetical protein
VELCIRTAKQQWTACNQTIYLKNWCHVIVATIVLRTISRAVKWFKKQPVTMSRRRPSSLANYSWNVCKDARKTGKFTRKLLERLNLWMWTKKSVFFLSFHGITTANPIYIVEGSLYPCSQAWTNSVLYKKRLFNYQYR